MEGGREREGRTEWEGRDKEKTEGGERNSLQLKRHVHVMSYVTHHVLGNIVLIFHNEYHVKARQDGGHEVNVL